MINDNVLFTLEIYKDGDFQIFDAKTKEPLKQISDKELIGALFDVPIKEEESLFSPFITYFKQNSGIVIIGGRRYRVP